METLTKIRYHRKQTLNISAEEMANRLGITVHTYAKIENGSIAVSSDLADLMEKVLGVKKDDLFEPKRYVAKNVKGVV